MPQNSWFHFLQRGVYSKTKVGTRNKGGMRKLQKETQQSMFYISSFPKVCLTLSPPSWESLGFWRCLMDNFSTSVPSSPTLFSPAEAQGLRASLAAVLLFNHTLSGFVSALSFSDSRHDSIPPDIERPYQAEPLVCGSFFHFPAWKCLSWAAPELRGPGQHAQHQELLP